MADPTTPPTSEPTIGELRDALPVGETVTIVFDGRAFQVTRWPDPPTPGVRR